jgi:plastocyanin
VIATQHRKRAAYRHGPSLLIALVLLTLAVGGCGGDVQSKQTEAHSASTDAHPAKPVAEQKIHIDNFTFDPAEVTVAVGTKVTWVNRDDVPHTATSTAKPKAFDSKTLDTDQQFSFVFDKAGTYEYYCAVHPKMTGKVIVK